jgi:hypothetical protein
MKFGIKSRTLARALPERRHRGNHNNQALAREHVGELAYSANIFVAIRWRESQVTAQVAADFVAIQLLDAVP